MARPPSRPPARPRPRWHRVAPVVVGAALLSAACSPGGPSLAEYAARAGEVCEDVQREADSLALPTAGPAFAESLRTSAELSRDEVEALVDLPEPRERRDDVAAWLDALGRRVTALEAYAGAVAESPPGEALPPVPDDLSTATAEAAELALELGIEACGAGVETPVDSAGAPVPTTVPTGPAPGSVPDAGATTTVTNDIGIPPDETTTQDQ